MSTDEKKGGASERDALNYAHSPLEGADAAVNPVNTAAALLS